MFGKKPLSVTKTYDNESERDRGVKAMGKQGYVVAAVSPHGGEFKTGKASGLGLAGALIAGPIGLLAGGLAGRKSTKWTVVYKLTNQ